MFYLRNLKRASSFGKKAENVLFMKPHEEKVIDACTVSTLKSTDEGVAFLVKKQKERQFIMQEIFIGGIGRESRKKIIK